MNPLIQQVLILCSVFLIILWFQNLDDKRTNMKRISLYEKYKLPVLVCSILGLIINLQIYLNDCNMIFISTVEQPIIQPIKESISQYTRPSQNQQIYTDLPDF